MGRFTAVVLLMLVALPLAAGKIYRSEDEEGRPVFSDQPPADDAEAEPLPDINIVPGTDASSPSRTSDSSSRTEPDRTEAADGYAGAAIAFPPADEATRRVTGRVPVRIALEPAGTELAEGHRVRVYVDGTVEGEAASTEVTVGPLNPGPHSVRASVLDADGRVLVETGEIRFHLIRQTVNN